ncbi:19032_t:CDS:2 [Funneliformis geosporum]|uniref:3335_t:CDS:1 n=1 Tax=Funneliformis geosporum TaxID=1117311 RepID=A0A9W4WTF2_9GLOM|nr:19032_t:CDS:2 [Funneliformis geosporum]CAI2170832.1 3335_t:CDS:2 [Funneliformis geosporum]
MSTEVSNNGVIFTKAINLGIPEIDKHFKYIKRKIKISPDVLEKDEILVRNVYLSLDPHLRNLMRSDYNLVEPFIEGNVMKASGIGIVVYSNNDQWKEGDVFLGWEEYSKISPDEAKNGLFFKKYLKEAKNDGNSLSYFLGILGMTGFTAYVGLYVFAKPKKDETIFISAAAGAVGQVLGQISKINGLRVIGSAGSDTKVDYLLKELKFDDAFNYKKINTDQALKETCPNGIDIYFDNVGGETLDIALTHLNVKARVISCGMISQYNSTTKYGVKNLSVLVSKRITIYGMLIFDHYEEHYDSFQKEMIPWLKEGKLKYKEHVVNGIENAPQAFLNIFNGKNFGKVVIKINDL